ncbi:MAG TPA: arsenite methyltransferase [Phycisphaerae bacterium]|nr:arsenite methyltransferase [Phycisphaerae bacterium]
MTDIREVVKSKYGAVAASGLTNAHGAVQAIAEAFGYSADELASIPAAANMGLSCGNPVATANLRPGEVVVDLGSGGGLDVFLAAKKVGPTGKAIGIDMTPEMLARARKAAADDGYTNVEFHRATIDKLPLPDNSVDCVISNCVINLAPDKNAVFREIFRVLKPGGRVAVSDIALKKALPAELAKSVMALVGCIAGAIAIADYRVGLERAGFSQVVVVDSGADLNAYGKLTGQSACCSPPMEKKKSVSLSVQEEPCCGPSCCSPAEGSTGLHDDLAEILSRYDVNAYAASVKVYAIKPA